MTDEQVVLGILWHAKTRRIPTAPLQKRAREITERPVDVASALQMLASRGVVDVDETGWQLVAAKRSQAASAGKQLMASAFDRRLLQLSQSAAYRRYCQHVYEADHFQFDMVDLRHREVLLQMLKLTADDHFVDVGCALGGLTHWVVTETGARGLGLDIAVGTIAFAAQTYPEVVFRVGDLDALDVPRCDAILAVDSLYFCADLAATTHQLMASLRPGGRLVATYTAKRPLCDDLGLNEMRLGHVLQELGAHVRGVDLTAEAEAMWSRALDACQDLESAFVGEGLQGAHSNLLREARINQARYAAGDARRWVVCAQR